MCTGFKPSRGFRAVGDPPLPRAQVRRQNNGSDCGAHVAHFARQLLETPPRPSMHDGIEDLKTQYGQLAAGKVLDVRGTLVSIVDTYVRDQRTKLEEARKASEEGGGAGSDTDAVEIVDAPAQASEARSRGTPADDLESPSGGDAAGVSDERAEAPATGAGDDSDRGGRHHGTSTSPPPASGRPGDESARAEAAAVTPAVGDSGPAPDDHAAESESDTDQPHIVRTRPPTQGGGERAISDANGVSRGDGARGFGARKSSSRALGAALTHGGRSCTDGPQAGFGSWTESLRTTRKRATPAAAIRSPSAGGGGSGPRAAQRIVDDDDDEVVLVSESPRHRRQRLPASQAADDAIEVDAPAPSTARLRLRARTGEHQ